MTPLDLGFGETLAAASQLLFASVFVYFCVQAEDWNKRALTYIFYALACGIFWPVTLPIGIAVQLGRRAQAKRKQELKAQEDYKRWLNGQLKE